ncbi:lipopolysaccharide biosynthesis protein [Treponema pedis]|uniref:lipopolysaccharide biosynthesis protein n=1 Tax=Treponema pedis TaxID=409322 RepID=UPI003D212266
MVKANNIPQTSSRRIARNTLMLFFRQIFIILVSLYTVRVVLNTLGAEDYGVYNVVAGVVTFFSFLSGAMASATQRFFSFALGEQNQETLNKTFTINIVIYIGIAILAIVLLETIGLWFIYYKLKVPFGRFEAVYFIFHFSILTFVASIIASPFMAIMIAHEDMYAYTYISIFESLMKLATVFVLKILNFDKLKIYAVLLFIPAVIGMILYVVICSKKYKECQFRRFYWDKNQFIQIIKFTGWTLFGQLTTVTRTHAVTILINQVFNPFIVSARVIATQVASFINIFSSNFNIGLYPSIIKSYAADKKDEMLKLVFSGCKLSFFLIWICALPLFTEMEYILTLWLKTPPSDVILFTRLALIEVIINTICLPVTTAARANGQIKYYELSLGFIQILIFVSDFILFKYFNAPAYIVFIVAATGNFFMLIVRLLNVKILIDFPVFSFLLKVLIPVILITFISGTAMYCINFFMPNTFIAVVTSATLSILFSVLCMGYIGLDKEERKFVLVKIKSKIGSIK